MKADQWQHVKELVEEAIALDIPERRPYLDRECRDDLALRREVESLIASHEQAGPDFSTLQRPL